MSKVLLNKIFGVAAGAALLFCALAASAAPDGKGEWRPAKGAVLDQSGKPGPKVAASRKRAMRGSVQVLTYRFARPELVTDAAGISDIRMAGAETAENPGEPVLPALGIRIAIPQGETILSVETIPGAEQLLAEGVVLRHGEDAYPLSRPELARGRTSRSAKIYGANDRFPAGCGERGGLQRKRGVAFETMLLHPVAYEPKSGRVVWYEEIVVEVTTAPEARGAGGTGAETLRSRLRSGRDRAAALELVDNPAVLDTYAAESAAAPLLLATPGGVVPLGAGDPPLPCVATANGGTGYVHVVVTTEALRPAFLELVNLRRAQGFSSGLVTLETIQGAYPGADTQESIRNFIRDAYNVWGTEYVLLGGDSAQLPPRLLYVEANGGGETDRLPSDLYFQCVDGAFNSDGDANWGEANDGDGGSDVDLYAEVAIGRVPAETLQEAVNWVRKTSTYEEDRGAGPNDYVRSALFVGEHLGFGGVSEYASEMMEQVRLGSAADGYTTAGFAPFDIYTDTETLYDAPTYSWDTADIVGMINANAFAVINHLGHSNTDYNMKMGNADADALVNEKPLFIYSQGCIAGAFDRDCIAEHFTTSTASGAFGGVWNARFGWGSYASTDGPSQRFNRRFWDACFGEGVPYLGTANRLSHERNAPIINRNCIRWCFYETNLFGDPIQELDGFNVRMELDREAYQSTADAVVTISMPALYAGGEQTVRLSLNSSGAGGIDVDCPFVGLLNRQALYRSAPVNLSLLGASHGDTLHAIWAARSRTDVAPIDDLPPVITDCVPENPDDGLVRVTWRTDEPARGGIAVGVAAPPADFADAHASYATAHVASVDGLPPFRIFAVAVWSEDLAGNRADLPVDTGSADMSDYLIVATVEREVRARFDLERDAGGWTVQDLTTNVCWEYGTPTYGPAVASRCWGTRLNGRYPDGAHAMLFSPAVQVGLGPVISFRQWYDIERTPDDLVQVQNADCGYIEVLSDGVWRDVGEYVAPSLTLGTVAGTSGGWQDVRIALPSQFANQPLRVRFRFVSDTVRMGMVNPAGWYIDGVTFSDFPANGLSLATLGIDDAAPGGNANGCAEPGEDFLLSLRTFNFSSTPVTIREGSFVLLVGGAASGLVTLTGGSPGVLHYGTLAPGVVSASAPFAVSVSPLTPPGTVVTVLQTLIGTDGTIYENRNAFTVRRTGPISGWVLDAVSNAGIPNVGMTATQSDTAYTTTTGANGAFAFPVTDSNVIYQVTADLGSIHMMKQVIAPTNGLTFLMGRPLLETEPAFIDIATLQGQDGTNASFTVRNRPEASGTLKYTVSLEYGPGEPGGWIVITNGAPLIGALVPGTEQVYRFYAESSELPPGFYTANIHIEAVAANAASADIPVTLYVEDVLMLAYQGLRVQDVAGGASFDGDGFLEPGEQAEVYVTIVNTNAYSAAFNLNAGVSVLSPIDGTVTLISNLLSWVVVPAGATAESDIPIGVAWDPSMSAPYAEFQVDGTDYLGRAFTFNFAITNTLYHSVTGRVQTITAFPLTPTGVVSSIAGAVVTAEAADGTVLSSAVTGSNGVYTINGLLADDPYWVRVLVTAGSTYVPPAGESIVPSADGAFDPVLGRLQRDFMTVNYGSFSNVPHLRLSRVAIDDAPPFGDGDGGVDPGETLNLTAFFLNDAYISALNVTGLLANAIFERPDCMAVVDGSVETPTNLPAGVVTPLAAAFQVTVDPGAVKGDYQRFWVTAATTNAPVLVWPFDFRVAVDPLYSVSGTITFSDGNTAAKWAATRVTASDDAGRTVSTVTPDAATGAYALRGLPGGAYTIQVATVPQGYERPDPFLIANLDADLANIDFTVDPWPVTVTPPAITITLDEGASTNQTLNLQNSGADPAGLDLDIRFVRTPADILPAEAAPAALAAGLPTDWTQLDASYASSELEILFHDGVTMAEREAYLQRHGLEAVFHFTRIPAVLARTAAGTLATLGGPAALAEPDVVAHLQPSARLTRNALPADPLFGELWGLHNRRQTGGTTGADIGAEAAWAHATGDGSVIVAVCDTGVMINHEDLEANIWTNPGESGLDASGNDKGANGIDDDNNGYVDDIHGWNVAYWTNDVTDVDGHGTHVAGTIGAVGDNGLGVCGVNWRVQLMPVRICDDSGNFVTSAYLAKALEYAMENGARISNLSWGGPSQSLVLYEMIRSGIADNHLFVIAAGNSAENIDDIPAYPASYSRFLGNIITVAAADHDDRLATFSSHGVNSVHLAAPGVDILSTVPSEFSPGVSADGLPVAPGDGSYAILSGTSMATPHVAGAAALLAALAPGASYDVIKAALLAGVRKDPELDGWVKTGGHLDLAQSVRCLGRNWLQFDHPAASANGLHLALQLPAADQAPATTNLNLTVNDPAHLIAGEYQATITVADDENNRRVVPVALTVRPRALPVIESVEVLNDADGDGYAEAGEAAALRIVLRNAGSSTIDDLKGTLGATTRNYGYLSGLDTALPDGTFGVTFPALPATNATFILYLYDGTVPLRTLAVNVPLFKVYSIAGTVVGPGSVPVANAIVEATGPHGAATTTAADGTFAIGGLPLATNYACRAIAPGFARWSQTVAAPAAGLQIVLSAPRVVLSTNRIAVAVQQGMSTQIVLNVANTGLSGYAFELAEAPAKRIGLFADRDGLGSLVAPLRQMGFTVDRFTNNFSVVRVFNPFSTANEIRQYVRYTWDDALLFPYDFIIADLAGTDGTGRPVPADEVDAYARYLERGGKVLFTGVNPLSRPDNRELADLLGLASNACDRIAETEGQMTLAIDAGAPFAALASGDRVAVAPGMRDVAAPSIIGAAGAVAGMTASAKIVREPVGDNGLAMLWTGNADSADWQTEGALQDLLRSFLWETLVAPCPVNWLEAAPVAGTAPAGSSTTRTLLLNGDRQLMPGVYGANLLLLGRADGEEVLPVQVELTVALPGLRAHNASGQVVDWRAQPLQGDGGEASCLIQVLWVGPNGVPDAPLPDGTPGGDDVALIASDTGTTFGYFGSGSEPPFVPGTFNTHFTHPFAPGTAGRVLFARAWDASSFASAMAYGDSSARHLLQYPPDEAADFGSWSVTNVVGNFRDTNGDSIPDLWTIGFRPDLDPRAPRTALVNQALTTGTNNIYTGALTAPAHVVVSEKFLFVLERDKHRLSVYNRATRALVQRYGRVVGNLWMSGGGDGEFYTPQGMGADPRAGQYRFAVADTSNNRIQIFTYNPATGAVTFERKFGTASAGPSVTSTDGTFWGPRGVAFTPGGDLVVSDTGNFRLQRFSILGVHKKTIALTEVGDSTTTPEGLCFGRDTNSVDGVWVADSHTTKRRSAFYRLTEIGTPVSGMIYGSQTTNLFDNPTDVKVWTVGTRQRLCVSDWGNHRIRVMNLDGTPLFDFGNIPGSQSFEMLVRPYGVTPVNGTNAIYVADQGVHKVVWFNLVLDADGDGMEDFWEDRNDLDSTRDDALEDPDGDGLLNIGEARARTNPKNRDTDGDGGGDLYEMVNNRDPLVPNAFPLDPAHLLQLSAFPVNVATGAVATITATFDQPPTNAVTAWFYNEAGACIGTLEMATLGSAVLTCGFPASAQDLGWVDVELRSLDMDPPIHFTNDLFQVVATAPAIWVRYPISAIRMTSQSPLTISIFWNGAAKPQVAPVESFKIEHAPALTPASWQVIPSTIQRVRPFGETSFSVYPLTDVFLDPQQNFFRLFRSE